MFVVKNTGNIKENLEKSSDVAPLDGKFPLRWKVQNCLVPVIFTSKIWVGQLFSNFLFSGNFSVS